MPKKLNLVWRPDAMAGDGAMVLVDAKENARRPRPLAWVYRLDEDDPLWTCLTADGQEQNTFVTKTRAKKWGKDMIVEALDPSL